MNIALIGLGKMGYNLALNMLDKGYEVNAFDILTENIERAQTKGVKGAKSIKELIDMTPKKRTIFLLLPAGRTVDDTIEELIDFLDEGDIIIDSGNSHYKDSMRRYKYLKQRGIEFLDCGISGGPKGALNGACLMVGGEEEVFKYCEKLFKDISVEEGVLYTGKPGTGHFVKMVHNGIEYGMMQSIAEGFEVLYKSDFDLDYEKIAHVYNHGSVVRSWLMELVESAFSKDKELDSIKGIMHSSGEGKWTVETALDLGVPAPVIALSVFMRYRSLEDDTFSGKIVAALRNEFGGHEVELKE
ncbi:MAG: decarboxylating 6-phosphogluconate dehydrogenase [Tissierellales bacterium]|nr:decarboxylating 6-phosphogluconate dehydrogenase [Tissierellales bacterium]